jgi:predicted ester cyclase
MGKASAQLTATRSTSGFRHACWVTNTKKGIETMSTEGNKATIHRFNEVMNTGTVDTLDEILAADFVWHNTGRRGVKAMKQAVIAFRTIFPDTHLVIEDVIAEGDKVVVRLSGSGTHKGEFFGIQPTGKMVTWTGIAIGRCRDGKIVEMWSNEDGLGRLRQLGVELVPPKGESEE